MVTTADFPQADRLNKVGLVATAIKQGKHTDEELESYIGLDSGARQGRYYRAAAEVLGLITNQQNYAILSPLGEEFTKLQTTEEQQNYLARCLVETPVFHEALQFIHEHEPNIGALKKWFRSFYPGATSTADRRFHTFTNYLWDAKLVDRAASSYKVNKYTGSVVKQASQPNQSLSGQKHIPNSTHAPPFSGNKTIKADIDAQKRERANQIHWNLVDGKSAYLHKRKVTPHFNLHIDLYAEKKGELVLYEMKSVDSEGKNLHAQIRKAVSQLYEYRYRYKAPNANLCIVTNYEITKTEKWLLDYLAEDRLIAYEWTNNFKKFNCRHDSGEILNEFAP